MVFQIIPKTIKDKQSKKIKYSWIEFIKNAPNSV